MWAGLFSRRPAAPASSSPRIAAYGDIDELNAVLGLTIAETPHEPIKKVLGDLTKSVKREISIMLKTDRHPNILRYFAKEEDENFIYIGTELCECNLATFIKDQGLRQKMETKTIFQQTADGLKHLHNLSISEYYFSSSVSKSNLTF